MNRPTPHSYALEYEFRSDDGDYTPTDGERAMIEDAIAGYLSAALAVEAGTGSLPVELGGVSDAIAYGKGFWRSCSGCHETNEGVPLGPFSNVLKCNLGMGCFECGGIGAIWDTTDYADMGRALTPASSAVEGEAVAWQWRSRVKGGAWDAWENGIYHQTPPPFMEVEHRRVPASPAPQTEDE